MPRRWVPVPCTQCNGSGVDRCREVATGQRWDCAVCDGKRTVELELDDDYCGPLAFAAQSVWDPANVSAHDSSASSTAGTAPGPPGAGSATPHDDVLDRYSALLAVMDAKVRAPEPPTPAALLGMRLDDSLAKAKIDRWYFGMHWRLLSAAHSDCDVDYDTYLAMRDNRPDATQVLATRVVDDLVEEAAARVADFLVSGAATPVGALTQAAESFFEVVAREGWRDRQVRINAIYGVLVERLAEQLAANVAERNQLAAAMLWQRRLIDQWAKDADHQRMLVGPDPTPYPTIGPAPQPSYHPR